MSAFKDYRNTEAGITGAMPNDARKAVAQKIAQVEEAYFKNPSMGDIGDPVTPTPVKTVLTGATPYQIYVFDMTADVSAGVYTFDFVEAAPNTESAAEL